MRTVFGAEAMRMASICFVRCGMVRTTQNLASRCFHALLLLIVVIGLGCQSSTSTDPSTTALFSMTLSGSVNTPRNFATHTMETLLTSDSTMVVVGSNTPIGKSITKSNYALLEFRGEGVGTRAINISDTALSPAYIMVLVDGVSYFAVTGAIDITEYPSVGGLVRGTFQAKLFGDNGSQLDVSNGRFAVKRVANDSAFE